MLSDDQEQDEGLCTDEGRASTLAEVRKRLQEADHLAARSEAARAATVYDEVVGNLLVLQGIDR
eukprot:CAMPEP_0115333792 /NCGR_PEP_ID=MMETSP0270-20121206/87567_1 /TAXON_ID=71861 /ORGANISM="Scrippsiella trochoidea, Strain CCMP3099" /LENGTH=63 /DNA_ID=CAMNT_0002754733 /DNA_START=32 /DNA_END=219 /DNA_ORIENTATION=+